MRPASTDLIEKQKMPKSSLSNHAGILANPLDNKHVETTKTSLPSRPEFSPKSSHNGQQDTAAGSLLSHAAPPSSPSDQTLLETAKESYLSLNHSASPSNPLDNAQPKLDEGSLPTLSGPILDPLDKSQSEANVAQPSLSGPIPDLIDSNLRDGTKVLPSPPGPPPNPLNPSQDGAKNPPGPSETPYNPLDLLQGGAKILPGPSEPPHNPLDLLQDGANILPGPFEPPHNPLDLLQDGADILPSPSEPPHNPLDLLQDGAKAAIPSPPGLSLNPLDKGQHSTDIGSLPNQSGPFNPPSFEKQDSTKSANPFHINSQLDKLEETGFDPAAEHDNAKKRLADAQALARQSGRIPGHVLEELDAKANEAISTAPTQVAWGFAGGVTGMFGVRFWVKLALTYLVRMLLGWIFSNRPNPFTVARRKIASWEAGFDRSVYPPFLFSFRMLDFPNMFSNTLLHSPLALFCFVFLLFFSQIDFALCLLNKRGSC